MDTSGSSVRRVVETRGAGTEAERKLRRDWITNLRAEGSLKQVWSVGLSRTQNGCGYFGGCRPEEKGNRWKCNYIGQRVVNSWKDGFIPRRILLLWHSVAWLRTGQIGFGHFVLVHRQFRVILLKYSLKQQDDTSMKGDFAPTATSCNCAPLMTRRDNFFQLPDRWPGLHVRGRFPARCEAIPAGPVIQWWPAESARRTQSGRCATH